MTRLRAASVADYLASLPPERRADVEAVRDVVLANLPERYRATGKRYDVGESCVRFRTVDDLPLELIGETIAATPVPDFLERYERRRAESS